MQLDAPAINNQYRWWEEAELRDLCTGVGLQVSLLELMGRFKELSAVMCAEKKGRLFLALALRVPLTIP
eukprot:902775-Pelagomonas_calceolata.AAC.2